MRSEIDMTQQIYDTLKSGREFITSVGHIIPNTIDDVN